MAFLLITGILQAQTVAVKEYISLVTDRNLYISGEDILFSANLISDSSTAPGNDSRILYCELLSSDGNKLSTEKFLIENGSTSGSMPIPNDAITAYYYLRAYTRYLRNFGPVSYAHSLLKIVNPANPAVLTSGLSDSTLLRTSGRTSFTESKIDIRTDKSSYSHRDTVFVTLSNVLKDEPGVMANIISVVPENTVFNNLLSPVKNGSTSTKKNFYSESKSLSLTGKLTDIKTGKPVGKTRVNLVIIGKGRDFMATESDENGDFYFTLPEYYGFRDILLSADARKKDSLVIQVDNDFCPLSGKFNTPAFSLNENERMTALQLANNLKLSGIFPGDSFPNTQYNPEYDKAFYGLPDEVLILDNYVELTSPEEYFNELAMYAKVRKNRGKPYFKIIGQQPKLNQYDPLVMIDWVAVDDPERILGIAPQNVEKIEIVNHIYVKGNYFYGGIINIISKHGDFAGIELPSSSVFISYRFLNQNQTPVNQDLSPHIPDLRNTIFWNPKVILKPGMDFNFNFTTSDTPGNYIILLKSLLRDGSILSRSTMFSVSK
ncbi:MAG: hypothetical protein AB9842_07190 [Bacteroidales bacterium]